MNEMEFEIQKYCSAHKAGMSKADTTAAILNVFSKHNCEATPVEITQVLDKDLSFFDTKDAIINLAK